MNKNIRVLADEAADAAFYAAVNVLKDASTEVLRILSKEGAEDGRTDLIPSAADHVLDQRES